MKNPKPLAAALALVLLLVACGSDSESSAESEATTDDAAIENDESTADDAMEDDGEDEAMSEDDDAMEDDPEDETTEDDAASENAASENAASENAMSEDEDGDGGDDRPLAIASQTGSLSIVSIDFSTAEIALVNNTDAAIDINGWVMCNFPTYAPISGVDPIGPGETVTVSSTVSIPATDGELALYTAEDFTDAEAIVTYVEWGSDGHTRASVATEAGIWDGTALTPDGSILTVGG